MYFLISDTFTDSLARLTSDEQKAVKTTAFDLQVNPANPGMQFHRIEQVRDKNFWSVRVSRDLRIIVHKTDDRLLMCYVGHHDPAYAWAARRRLETHPTTGAAQLIEIRETVQEYIVPKFVDKPQPRSGRKRTSQPVLEKFTDEELLGYGVPAEWLPDVRLATDESLLDLVTYLPAEAAEALLELATGGKPRAPHKATADPFQHPDAQRRFRIMSSVEELAIALEYPWDKWTVFLHPEQRQLVQKSFNGPARVSGSAGTGKTIVALHRAVHLARENPDARVLLTTFTDQLADALQTRVNRLVENQPRLAERIDIYSLPAVAKRLYTKQFGSVTLAEDTLIRALIQAESERVGSHRFTKSFLIAEWRNVVDAWQLTSWDSYRSVARLGRKTRLPEAQRELLWKIFSGAQSQLTEKGVMTEATMFSRLAESMAERRSMPFDFVVIDEAQDVGVAQMKFFAAIAGGRANGLFFAGDLGQRIFQEPFSWKSLGVDIRGRSSTLRVNYRTSHQIREQADRLLDTTVSDVDGNTEERNDAVSVFNGPPPAIQTFKTAEEEQRVVGRWIMQQTQLGVRPVEFGVFVRSEAELPRAIAAVQQAMLPFQVLDNGVTTSGAVTISTMHLAKGLEFRAVVVMACDDEVIPSQERIENIGDEADLKEVYETERHLLYVACTRARDCLLVTSVEPRSEFLDDIMQER